MFHFGSINLNSYYICIEVITKRRTKMDLIQEFEKWVGEDTYIKQVSIDCVIFGFHDNNLKVLLPKLKLDEDLWALPGGYIGKNESVLDATRRILESRTGLVDIHLEQFGVFGELNRSSKDLVQTITNKIGVIADEHLWLFDRFISLGFYALVEYSKVTPRLNNILDESCKWYSVKELPALAIDHAEIIQKGLETLRIMLDHKLVGFNLLGETFTMKELQKMYETILDKPLRRDNFQRKMLDMDILERLEKQYTGAANKAPYLYKLKTNQ